MINGDEAGEGEIEFADELKPGTQLMLGQYTIDRFLAAGGFGITYLAYDSLKRPVVIKECFPGSFCRRQNHSVMPRSRAHQEELKSIVRHFSKEALTLSKARHPNIVGVHQVFEENNTAYMALDYVEGRDLLEILKEDADGLTSDQIESYLERMLDAIGHVHARGLLHRDISPDNIIVSTEDEPVLIDFGAARETADKKASRLLSALRVVKDGYSPQEFYIVGSQQGPSCDLYSLAASFYHIITGDLPPDSQSRLTAFAAGEPDPYIPLATRSDDYSKNFSTALDKAMSILPKDRMQSAEDWLSHIQHGESLAPSSEQSAAIVAANANAGVSKVALVGGGGLVLAAGVALAYFAMRPDDDADVLAQVEQPAIASEAPEPTESPVSVDVAVAEAEDAEEAPSTPAEVAAVPSLDAEPDIGDQAPPELPLTEDVAEIAEEPVETSVLATLENVSAPPSRPETLLAEVPTESPEEDTLAPVPETVAEIDEQVQASDVDSDLAAVQPEVIAEQAEPAEEATLDVADVEPEEETEASVEEVAASDVLEEERPLIASTWSVRLPFSAADDDPSHVGEVLLNAWSWLQTGTRIASVNGIEVDNIEDIPALLRQSSVLSDQTQLDLRIGAAPSESDVTEEFSLMVPIIEIVTLENGVKLESAFRDGAWQTSVTEVPADATTQLTVGDVVLQHLPTGARMDARTSLYDALISDQDRASSENIVLVSRGGDVIEVALFETVVEAPLSADARPQVRPQEPVESETASATTNVGTIEAASVMEIDVPSVPFELSQVEPGVVTTVSETGPFWLSPGVRIVSVNGTAVADNAALLSLVTQAVRSGGGEATIVIGTDARLSDAAIERRLTVGSERQTVLLNGLTFVSALEDGATVTRVVQAPAGSAFRVGDKVVAYMATGEKLDQNTTLKSILDRELAAGRTSFSFAIERQGEMWVEGFNLAALIEQ